MHISRSTNTSFPKAVVNEEIKQNQCTKVVFILFDYLDRWLREWMWQKNSSNHDDYIKVQVGLAIFFQALTIITIMFGI